MKKIIFLFASFVSLISYSQINYQAQYSQNGIPVANTSINVQIDILDLTISGTSVYQETFTTTTNSTGIFTIAIGKGLHLPSVSIDSVKWATDKFVALKINNVLQGTTQIMQVPTAKYAETAKKPYIKDLVLGVDYTIVPFTMIFDGGSSGSTFNIVNLTDGNENVISVSFCFERLNYPGKFTWNSDMGLYDDDNGVTSYHGNLAKLSTYKTCIMYINTTNGLYRIKMK
jgi:hypothetical protein